MTLVPPNTRPNSILALTPLGRCPILQIRTLKCKWGYVTDFRSFVPHKVLVTHPAGLANERANARVCNTASPCQESVRTPHTTSLAVAPTCSHVPRHPATGPWLIFPVALSLHTARSLGRGVRVYLLARSRQGWLGSSWLQDKTGCVAACKGLSSTPDRESSKA